MTPDQGKSAKGGLPWYTWDVILLGVLFLFGTFGNSFPLLSYLGGLHNDKGPLFGAVMWFMLLLIPVAGLCLLALVVRIVVYWPLHMLSLRRWAVLGLLAGLGSAAYVGLPFARLGPPLDEIYLRGFRKHVQRQVDISAIRAWLNGLDPNGWDGVEIDVRRTQDDELVWTPEDVHLPASIVRLKPRYVELAALDESDLAVDLRWGSGMLGTWGLTVGPETMGAPPSRLRGDQRLDAGPGVYVWHDIE
jgi:hypothetical protein